MNQVCRGLYASVFLFIQQQAAGEDTSALTALKAQLDSALSEAGQGQTGSTKTIADNTIDALIDLPREALSDTDYNALMSAYRTFEANPSETNAAKIVQVAKQILGKMDIAQLEQAGVLTEEQARAL